MNRATTRCGLVPGLCGVLLVLAWPSASAAQQRPSIERLQEWVCAKADEDGDSHRPPFCDAQCNCVPPAAISAAASCAETASGIFEAAMIETGSCAEVCLPDYGTGIRLCSGFSGNTCPGTCPGEETCLPFGYCAQGCSDDTECTKTVSCDNSPLSTPCLDGNDCLPGSICSPLYEVCLPVSCTQDSDCDLLLGNVTLAGVSTPEDVAPVTCTYTAGGAPPTVQAISSNDALECISQIGTTLGQACTPFTP